MSPVSSPASILGADQNWPCPNPGDPFNDGGSVDGSGEVLFLDGYGDFCQHLEVRGFGAFASEEEVSADRLLSFVPGDNSL